MTLDPLAIILAAALAAFLLVSWRGLVAAVIFVGWVTVMTAVLLVAATIGAVVAAAGAAGRVWRG